jgi:hypothetical protein
VPWGKAVIFHHSLDLGIVEIDRAGFLENHSGRPRAQFGHHLDQLLNSIEEQNYNLEFSSAKWPLYLTLGNWERRRPISELGKRNLTRPFRGREVPRLIDPGACRDWVIESKGNWIRIIPEGREMLLELAREHKDTEFLEAIERFERPVKNARSRKGK